VFESLRAAHSKSLLCRWVAGTQRWGLGAACHVLKARQRTYHQPLPRLMPARVGCPRPCPTVTTVSCCMFVCGVYWCCNNTNVCYTAIQRPVLTLLVPLLRRRRHGALQHSRSTRRDLNHFTPPALGFSFSFSFSRASHAAPAAGYTYNASYQYATRNSLEVPTGATAHCGFIRSRPRPLPLPCITHSPPRKTKENFPRTIVGA
jgi:hypothetical protein